MNAHRRKLAAAATAVLALGLITFFAEPSRADFLHFNPQDEISLGRDASQRFERSARLMGGPQLERIRRIGARVAQQTGRPEYVWQFKLVDTSDINAITFPGGFIYVFRGLLDQGLDDNMLAGVLGHECTHAAKSHAFKKMFPIMKFMNLKKKLTGSERPGLVTKLLMIMTNSGLGQRFELEADRLGAGFACKAGYDPEGLIGVFHIFERLQRTRPTLMQRLLATHPQPSVRIRKLRPVIARLKSQGCK